MEILYLIAKVIDILLGVIYFAMFLRVILSLFTSPENKLNLLCVLITEPFIAPFRLLLMKLNIGQDLPIDMSFMVAYLALFLIRLLLPII